MKSRNLDQLKNLPASKKFADYNSLKIHIFEKGDLVFYNDCFFIHVYAFLVENIPYIDLYFIGGDEVLGANIDHLIQKANLVNETKKLYENVKKDHLIPLSWEGESNSGDCLIMEQNYITYLSVINRYLPKIFIIENSSKTIQNFESMNSESRMKFEKSFEIYNKTDKKGSTLKFK